MIPAPVEHRSWDFFLIHAAADKQHAAALHALIDPSNRAFLDERSLSPGTLFPDELGRALNSTRIFVALISHHLANAWYAQEEIVTAIRLVRQKPSEKKIVPIYIEPSVRTDTIPYGLRLLQAIDLIKSGGWAQVALKLIQLLKDSGHEGNAITSPSLSHVLHAYPRGPALNEEHVKSSVVREYSRLITIPSEEAQVIADAISLRREADPDDPTIPVIDTGKLLPSATSPPFEYWSYAFREARKNGPRMLAALLHVVTDDLFEPKARAERRKMLQMLAALPA